MRHFLHRGEVDLRLRAGRAPRLRRVPRRRRSAGAAATACSVLLSVSTDRPVLRRSLPRWAAAAIPSCRSSSFRFFTRSLRDSLSILVARTARSTVRATAATSPRRDPRRAPGAGSRRDGGRPRSAWSPPKYASAIRRQLDDRFAAAPGVAVARQVREVEAPVPGTARAPFDRHLVQVGQPGLAGRRARARHLDARQRVEQRRLADIGSPDERHVRYPVMRDASSIRGAGDESGF